MPSVSPLNIIHIIQAELRAGEECTYCSSDKERSKCSVYKEENIECLLAKNISRFRSEFVCDCLYDEAEKNCDPDPICSSEACCIKERESCKECTSECHQCCKSEFPFSAQCIY